MHVRTTPLTMLAALVLLMSACSSDGEASSSSQPATPGPSQSLLTEDSPDGSGSFDGQSADEARPTPSTTLASTSPALADDYGVVLDSLVSEFVAETPGGIVVLVREQGDRYTASVGMASQSEAMTPATVFRVGSISKSLIAVMVMQLVDEGVVELDEPLATYLPDTPVGGAVLVRQLLSHQSGIPNYTEDPLFFAQVIATPDRQFTPEDVVDLVANKALSATGVFSYSNTNYILLGQLIEELDERDLGASLKARITDAAGMTSTTFSGGGESLPAGLAGGWSTGFFTGDQAAEYSSIESSAWAAGALLSTAGDLEAFLDALLLGDLVSEDSLALMTKPTSSGYGLGLVALPFGINQTGYGHGGRIPGFTSMMAMDAQTGTVLVVLSNNDQLIADELLTTVLDSLPR